MMQMNNRSRVASDPELYERIKSILARYPETTAAENEELLYFFRRGPMLDRALLSGVAELHPQLAKFEADHRAALSLGLAHYLFAAVILFALLVSGYFLWDVGL